MTKAQLARLAYRLNQYAVHTSTCGLVKSSDMGRTVSAKDCTCGLGKLEVKLWKVVTYGGRIK